MLLKALSLLIRCSPLQALGACKPDVTQDATVLDSIAAAACMQFGLPSLGCILQQHAALIALSYAASLAEASIQEAVTVSQQHPVQQLINHANVLPTHGSCSGTNGTHGGGTTELTSFYLRALLTGSSAALVSHSAISHTSGTPQAAAAMPAIQSSNMPACMQSMLHRAQPLSPAGLNCLVAARALSISPQAALHESSNPQLACLACGDTSASLPLGALDLTHGSAATSTLATATATTASPLRGFQPYSQPIFGTSPDPWVLHVDQGVSVASFAHAISQLDAIGAVNMLLGLLVGHGGLGNLPMELLALATDRAAKAALKFASVEASSPSSLSLGKEALEKDCVGKGSVLHEWAGQAAAVYVAEMVNLLPANAFLHCKELLQLLLPDAILAVAAVETNRAADGQVLNAPAAGTAKADVFFPTSTVQLVTQGSAARGHVTAAAYLSPLRRLVAGILLPSQRMLLLTRMWAVAGTLGKPQLLSAASLEADIQELLASVRQGCIRTDCSSNTNSTDISVAPAGTIDSMPAFGSASAGLLGKASKDGRRLTPSNAVNSTGILPVQDAGGSTQQPLTSIQSNGMALPSEETIADDDSEAEDTIMLQPRLRTGHYGASRSGRGSKRSLQEGRGAIPVSETQSAAAAVAAVGALTGSVPSLAWPLGMQAGEAKAMQIEPLAATETSTAGSISDSSMHIQAAKDVIESIRQKVRHKS